MIKICIILFSDGMGGAEQVVMNIIRQLEQNRFKFYLVTNTEMITYFEKVIDRNKIFNIGKLYTLSNYIAINKFLNQLHKVIDVKRVLLKRKLKKINNFIKEYDIHILHAHLKYDLVTCIALKRMRPSLKIIFTVHSFLNIFKNREVGDNNLNRKFVRLLKNVDYFTCVSKSLQKTLEQFSFAENNCAFITNALDRDKFNNETLNHQTNFSPKRKKDIKLLFLGGDKKVKGGKILLQALKIVLNKYQINHFILTILGPINKKGPFYRKQLQDQELKNNLKIVGFVNPPFHRTYIQNSDIVVIPSLSEGFALVGLEAIRLGKPIIASNCDAIQELIKDNENGLLCDLNPESLAKIIKKMIQDEDLRRKISDNNLRYKIPYWDQIISKYADVYQKVSAR